MEETGTTFSMIVNISKLFNNFTDSPGVGTKRGISIEAFFFIYRPEKSPERQDRHVSFTFLKLLNFRSCNIILLT